MNRALSIDNAWRAALVLALAFCLSGCVHWWRAYQVYLQLDEFDRYFSVEAGDEFVLRFKKPVLLNTDFVAFANLYPSEDNPTVQGRRARYWFRKVDANQRPVRPEVKFYSDMDFNHDRRLTAWSFSALFLEIAPPQFLEVSLRSLGGADIDQDKRQLRADSDKMAKITAPLPDKRRVVAKLGPPLAVEDLPDQQIYTYHFLLDTPRVEPGHEANALNVVRLSFAKDSDALFNMAGNFAGLKVSINYREFLAR